MKKTIINKNIAAFLINMSAGFALITLAATNFLTLSINIVYTIICFILAVKYESL